MSPERKLEAQLVKLARREGWLCRKLRWIGRNGAPDRLVISPTGQVRFLELKSPGKKSSAVQLIEHRELVRFHQLVHVVDDIGVLEEIFRYA